MERITNQPFHVPKKDPKEPKKHSERIVYHSRYPLVDCTEHSRKQLLPWAFQDKEWKQMNSTIGMVTFIGITCGDPNDPRLLSQSFTILNFNILFDLHDADKIFTSRRIPGENNSPFVVDSRSDFQIIG